MDFVMPSRSSSLASAYRFIGPGLYWLLALALLCLAAWPSPAKAQNTGCWITDSPSIAFGTVDGGGASTASTLSFRCNNYTDSTVSYRMCVFINPNSATPDGVAPRRMVNWGVTPNTYLNYDFYADPAYAQLLGSETSGHAIYNTVFDMTQNGQSDGSMPVYARVPAGQTVAAGGYNSQNTVVLRFAVRTGTTAPSAEECAASSSMSSNYTLVTTNYANSCFIGTATDLDFGEMADLDSAQEQTSRISLHCPAGTAWRVALDYGNSGGGARRMSGPGGAIAYQLYRDPGRSQIWGNTTADDVTGTGDNTTQNLTVYGRVPAQDVSVPGQYSDTVTVTLTY